MHLEMTNNFSKLNHVASLTCRSKQSLKTLPVSKRVLLNRKADHTCTGIQYEIFEYTESFINHYYQVEIYLIRSSNERHHKEFIKTNMWKKGGGFRKICQKLRLLPPFLVPGIKNSNKRLQVCNGSTESILSFPSYWQYPA